MLRVFRNFRGFRDLSDATYAVGAAMRTTVKVLKLKTNIEERLFHEAGIPFHAASTELATQTQSSREPDDQQVLYVGREMVRLYQAETSRYDLLVALITGCIAEGLDTRDSIIATVPKVGVYRHAHVAHTLDSQSSGNLETSNWHRGEDGKYRLPSATCFR